MLSTVELEKYVRNEIESKLGDEGKKELDIYFMEGNSECWPGDYVFEKDRQYHFLSIGDRGGIVADRIMFRVEDILYKVVDLIAFKIASKYTAKDENPDLDLKQVMTDSRKKQFEKEIEICSMFGEEFKERKCTEIKEILERFPYKD